MMDWNTYHLDSAARHVLQGCPAGYDAFLLADLAQRLGPRGLVHVCADDHDAESFREQILFFAPQLQTFLFPAWDCLPYDRTGPSRDVSGARLAVLAALLQPPQAFILITTAAAFTQLVLPVHELKNSVVSVVEGATVNLLHLNNYLVAHGYSRTDVVRDVGDYAWRGGILDIFPGGAENPIRLDFFGNTLEKIRVFDALSQLTIGTVSEWHFKPATEISLSADAVERFRTRYRELFGAGSTHDALYQSVTAGRMHPGIEHWQPLFFEKLVPLLSYTPHAAVSFSAQAAASQQARCEQIAEYYQARHDFLTASKTQKNHANIYKPIPTSWLYWPADDVEKTLSQHVCITLSPFADEGGKHDAGARAGADFAAARQQGSRQLYEAVKFYLAQQKTRVIMACHSAGSRERLSKTFSEQHIVCAVVSSLGAARQLPEKTLALGVFNLAHGFRSANMTIITEQDMMGDRLARREKKKRASEAFQLELSTLAIGDLLVHAEHGIGRYDGLLALDVLGAPHDCIKLLYQGGDKLFVPVENMDLLSRYGSDTSEGALDKLGGAGWQQRKARVKKRLKDMADALMKVAAARAAQQGEVMDAPEGLYEEFSARFPYVETDDQARAIDAVRDDLSSGKPMDRLVCGDVGFGKTEVALRAAFIAAQAGMQVAVLVPTTLLARQHYQNFSKRFAGLPFKIAQLSRFISALDAKKIKADLQEGKIDVVIGTHALLTKDLSFKNLGLLIVDEEQHFGVKQKERLKELKNNVHILTLSATPIPRTLQLSLAGVRDLSLITTPPIDRLAVHSFVLPYDPMIIRQAIMREHFRGGQVFYVCPRIEDLEDMTKQLAELVPEVRIVMAHGRMPPAQLDDIMTAFDSAEFDVLLSTNIVESGLDIPNANTMIIHRADMFGLSQLYQLRGRVGRGKQRAYAYFTYAQTLNEMAQRRLEIIQTLDQLGAGFQLASHDMDLRGAGNLLGEEQSGHIREVGVELYQQMLEDAVNNAKQHGENIESDWTPQINLGLSVLIPEKYVADLNVRLALYRRASQLADDSAIELFAAELIDRFGPLPAEVENLLQVIRIKQQCKNIGVSKVDAGPQGAVVTFYNDQFRGDAAKLVQWLGTQAGSAKLRPDQKLVLVRVWPDAQDRLRGMTQSLRQLSDLAA